MTTHAQNPQERRRHRREIMFVPVRLFVNEKKVVRGEIEDLSIEGAYIRCVYPFVPGDMVKVEIHLAGLRSVLGNVIEIDDVADEAPLIITIKAEIRWENKGVGIGVKFKNLPRDIQKLFEKLVQYFKEYKKSAQLV